MGYSKQEVLEILRRGFVYRLVVRYFYDKTQNDIGVMKGRGINEPTTQAMYRLINERVRDGTEEIYVQVEGKNVYVIDPEFIRSGYTVTETLRVYINKESSLYKGGGKNG